MADLDQNFSEVEHAHQNDYQHEDEYGHEQEFVPVHELPENEEHKNESIEGIPENLEYDEKQDHEDVSLSGGGAEKWPGWPGESVFRMLVPAQKVGSIIGRKGEYIKKTCEETKARIKILDGPPGTRERAPTFPSIKNLLVEELAADVMISAKEEPEAPLPPAVDGLLKVHKRLVDGMENDPSHPAPGLGGKLSTRLLVPAAQAGSLIGKQGTTVKSIQEESNCIVRVLGTEHRVWTAELGEEIIAERCYTEDLPLFALQDDRIVEVVGEPTGIHKAVELIATHLRKFLVDRSIIHVLEMHMQMPNSQMDHTPPAHSWGPPPQAFQQNAPAGPGYGASHNFMPPPRQFDNYYTPSNMPPPPEKQSHQGVSAYGREALVPAHSSTTQTAQSIITQITQQMQIPLAYADAVIGTQGANISYIRRVSGATVTIQETRGVPGEMTVEISGTASQVQTAQQMIQNFMADASGSTQAQYASSADPSFNSYVAHGSVYTSPPSNANVGGQSGGYSSVYGANYGY